MKTIFIFVIGLTSCLNNNTTNSKEARIYYFEDTKNEFIMSPKKSIIELKNDSIYIIDFPMDPAGMLNYSLGTFKESVKSSQITFEIQKSVTFSMNIGQVVRYTENCKTQSQIEISEKGELVREKRKDAFQINAKGDWVSYENVCMNYKIIKPKDLTIQYNWVHMLDKYTNSEKLNNCK